MRSHRSVKTTTTTRNHFLHVIKIKCTMFWTFKLSFLFACFFLVCLGFVFFLFERKGLTVSNSLCKPVWLWTHKDPHQWGWGWASLVLGLKAHPILIDNFIIPYCQLKSSIIYIKIFLVVFKLELSIINIKSQWQGFSRKFISNFAQHNKMPKPVLPEKNM